MTTTTPPPFLPFNPDGIPADLRTGRRFVPWYGRQKADGRWDKVPMRKRGAEWSNGSSTDRSTWLTFDAAVAAHQAGAGDGVSIIMHEDEATTGIDLDHCVTRDGDQLVIAPWALEAMALFPPTIWMLSVSGTGIRGFVGERKPAEAGAKRGNYEAYDGGRHLTLTGHLLPGSASTLAQGMAAAAALATFCDRYLGAKPAEPARPITPAAPVSEDDEALLDRARRAANGAKFSALFDRGDLGDYNGDASAADLALSSLLRFYTGADMERMDRLFRRSALMRAKWDEKHSASGLTYGQMSLTKALPGDVYRAPETKAALILLGDEVEDDEAPAPLSGDVVSMEVFERLAAELRQVRQLLTQRDEIIETQRAALAASYEEVAELRAVKFNTVSILNGPLKPEAKVAELQLAYRLHGDGVTPDAPTEQTFYSMPDLARGGASEDTLRRMLDATAKNGVAFERGHQMQRTNPWTGEKSNEPHLYMTLKPRHATLSATLADLAAHPAEELKAKKRVCKPKTETPAQPEPVVITCRAHPHAGKSTAYETGAVTRCDLDGDALWIQLDDTNERLVSLEALPQPQTAVVGTPPSAARVSIGSYQPQAAVVAGKGSPWARGGGTKRTRTAHRYCDEHGIYDHEIDDDGERCKACHSPWIVDAAGGGG